MPQKQIVNAVKPVSLSFTLHLNSVYSNEHGSLPVGNARKKIVSVIYLLYEPLYLPPKIPTCLYLSST